MFAPLLGTTAAKERGWADFAGGQQLLCIVIPGGERQPQHAFQRGGCRGQRDPGAAGTGGWPIQTGGDAVGGVAHTIGVCPATSNFHNL